MRYQNGSSILIVIMAMSVISVITAASMRSALTGREQAVNSLVDHILDAENVTSVSHFTSLNKSSNSNNSIHTQAKNNSGEEFVFCTKNNRANNYSLSDSSVMRWVSNAPNNSKIGINGYCKADDATDYRTDRKTTLTQIAIRRTTQTATSFSNGKVTSGDVYVITATSLLPKMSKATDARINSCLNGRVNNMTMVTTTGGTAANRKPVVDCLRDLGVPALAVTHTYIR